MLMRKDFLDEILAPCFAAITTIRLVAVTQFVSIDRTVITYGPVLRAWKS
jgi:hypothetical protein